MGFARTYTNVASIFSNNHEGYQPLGPLRGAVRVAQSKRSRLTRRLLFASLVISVIATLSFLVSHAHFESWLQPTQWILTDVYLQQEHYPSNGGDRASLWSSSPMNIPKANLHLLVPASSAKSDLCKVMVSSGILGYPTPTLINWGMRFNNSKLSSGGSHIAKIAGIQHYLQSLDAADHDLVLVVDGYDIWFQLRPQTLLDRYFDINRRADARLKSSLGSSVMRTHDVSQNIVFSCQKQCWPFSLKQAPCYAVPNSTLPADIYGPETDIYLNKTSKNPYLNVRQRFLNSGVAIGTVKAMRELYSEALARVEKDPNFGSDQFVISQIFGDQELYREVLRQDSVTWWQRWLRKDSEDPQAQIFNPSHIETVRNSSRRLEFGLGIDYESSISLATIFAPEDAAWLTFNNATNLHEANDKLNITKADSRINYTLSDVALTDAPFATADLDLGPTEVPWTNVSIFTNVRTGFAPAIVHHNAWQNNMKSRRVHWWSKIWFHKHARALYTDYAQGPDSPITVSGYPYPIEWWSSDKRRGGALNGSEWIGYEDLCLGTEDEVFRDKGGPWLPAGVSRSDWTPKQQPGVSPDLVASYPNDQALPLRITVMESGGSHDEVVAALVHSLGSQNAEIDLYQLLPRYGIKDIMRSFSLEKPLRGPRGPPDFMKDIDNAIRPDIFVAATCELDIIRHKKQLDVLLAEGNTHMVCVVHHADRWADPKLGLEEAIRPWVTKGLVEFWTLSPHTERFLRDKSMSQWTTVRSGDISPVVRTFVPVFPITLPATPDTHNLAFGLQGDYDPSRRDYKSIFEHLDSFLRTDSSSKESDAQNSKEHARNVTMHLLGHGEHPSVPDNVKDHVIFDERLDYIDYYKILSQTFALLPAFASDTYLDRKASSSVPAALIAGTPLIATKAIIEAYSYISEDTVWLQEDGESEFNVVQRVLDMDSDSRKKKMEAVREKRSKLVQENIKLVEDWMNQAMIRMEYRAGSI
ncbi:hypothetical protein E4T47_07872 [Aureobasidium subglaciale]|nr:hypothetical protein E4T47_07872 [Aureobasidium subglaciale]